MYGFRRLAILLLAPLLFSQAAWAKPAVVDIRLGIHPSSTRIVVELSEPAAYRVGLLAGPARLYIELPESDWQGSRLPGMVGQVRSLAMTTNGGITKLTADLRGNAKIGSAMLILGNAGGQSRRLVVDLLPAATGDFSAAVMAAPIDSDPPLVVSNMASAIPAASVLTAPAPAASAPAAMPTYADSAAVPLLKPVVAVDILPAGTGAVGPSTIPARSTTPPGPPASIVLVSAVPGASVSSVTAPDPTLGDKSPTAAIGWPPGVPVLRPMSSPLPLVYIDPGHGGPDPGTIGHNGTYEKNVTLAVAQELQRQLIASGRYRVRMTRTSDQFVALRTRFEMARIDHADIFISLHADSSFVGDPRGLSIYTLSETSSDAEAAALAAKENKADLIAGIDLSKQNGAVTSILIDLAQRESKNLSAHLAELLVNELGRVTLLLPNTHRYAGFAVLKAPDIPSVLIELGYLSDVQDEALLLSAAHRAKLAAAMLRAVDGYFTVTVASGKS
jgi:N-acetylmuramoyl-L-alanine amidase